MDGGTGGGMDSEKGERMYIGMGVGMDGGMGGW